MHLFKVIFVSVLTLLSFNLFSQNKLIYTSSGDAIERGSKSFEKENYSSAMSYFEKVHPGDTNYFFAQYKKAETLVALEKYDQAIALCLEEIKEQNAATQDVYIVLASAYEKQKKFDQAIETYSKAIETFPMYAPLFASRSNTYFEMEKNNEAILDLQMALKLNPYSIDNHKKLGDLAKEEGQLAKAMLCYNTVLLMQPSNNLEFLSMYNDFVSSEYEGESKGYVLSTEDYSAIDELIKNRVALDKKYKTGNKLSLPLVKQNHLLLDQLSQRELTNGFWDTYYVPFYKEVFTSGNFNNLMYYELISSNTQSIVSVLNKNIKGINGFTDYAGPLWLSSHSKYTENYLGKEQEISYVWRAGHVEGRGVMKDDQEEGIFEYYYSTGGINAYIDYGKNGVKEGTWTFYNINGNLVGVENYEEGVISGVDSAFYENGIIKSIDFYSEGKLNGLSKNYFDNGALKSTITYKDGSQGGPATYYYQIGIPHYEVNYVDDKLQGSFIEYYDNGSIAEEVTFMLDERDGLSKEYYKNGQLRSEITYAKGKAEGPFKTYYSDGTLKSEGEYKEGILINNLKEYNQNGRLASEGIYDENGKQTGIYKEYDLGGNLNLELNYKKGEMISYTVYHKDGSVITEAKKKSGEFLFENYYSDGTIKSKGYYQPGDVGKNGIWKFYDKNGVLDVEENYANGSLNGTVRSYFANGKLYATTPYKDGQKDGLYVRYYRNGKISQQGYYLSNNAEGTWLNYEADGTISSEMFYQLDQLNGPQQYNTVDGSIDILDFYKDGKNTHYIMFDTAGNGYQTVLISMDTNILTINSMNGKKIRTYQVVNNIVHGPSTSYHPNGQIRYQGDYHNGRKNGPWVGKHRNGKLSYEGNYFYGDKEGEWKYYNDEGVLIRSEIFQNGVLHGPRTWYHDNGKLDTEKTFEFGLENGPANYYDRNGVLQYIRYYYYGKHVGYSYNGPDGKPVAMIPVTNETCDCEAYFPNGKVSRSFHMVNGEFEGEYKEYYENGQLFNDSKYENNETNGVVKSYYENGTLLAEKPYTNDELNGVLKSYHPNGKLASEETYLNGVLHGTSKYYNTSGKLTEEVLFIDGIELTK